MQLTRKIINNLTGPQLLHYRCAEFPVAYLVRNTDKSTSQQVSCTCAATSCKATATQLPPRTIHNIQIAIKQAIGVVLMLACWNRALLAERQESHFFPIYWTWAPASYISACVEWLATTSFSPLTLHCLCELVWEDIQDYVCKSHGCLLWEKFLCRQQQKENEKSSALHLTEVHCCMFKVF